MPLIAIAGAQGQGKSTVLTSLSEMGFNVIPHKTSRSILTEWGFSLSEIHKDPELTKKFQDEILFRHIENNKIGIESNELYFTERSYADIFTYTILAIGSFNEYNVWLDEYYYKCKLNQKSYHGVIKLRGLNSSVEDDGVRSINLHFTNVVDLLLNYYIDDFNSATLIVNTPDHDERIGQILEYINEL